VCCLIALCVFGLAVVARAGAVTFIVTSTADAVDAAPGDGVCAMAGGMCTLRAAIQEANALSGADSITLPAGTYALGILGAGEDAAATGDLDITGDLSITGATTGQTIVSGAAIDRVFDILSPAVVSLSRLTVQSGNASTVAAAGGGIRNAGTLNLSLLTMVNNTANGDGGGLANLSGGNTRLTNVTLTGNRSLSPVGLGGGIANDMGATLQLTNVTVNGNSAHQGGGVDNLGNVQAVNTIIANSLPGSTCAGAAITSLGHNLDSSMTCFFPTGPGDLQNADPKLDTLLDTGSTFVFPLKTGSPAIDAGDNLKCPSTDQRGQLRPADGNGDMMYLCDIGAYEVTGPVLPTPTASATGTATSTPSPPTATNTPTPTSTPAGGSISLSRVIGHPGEQVVFTATLSTKGASIASTQNDVAFDSTSAPVAPLLSGAPDCTVNPQIGKEATSFAFQPQGCSGAACNSLRASVLSATNTNAIADRTVLYMCRVGIVPGVAAGEYPLTISGVVLQGPDGQPLPNPVGSSGAVVVVVPTPTPMPGPADCCQCVVPAVCGPATGGCGNCTVVFGASCDGSTGQCVTATVTPTASRTATPLTTSTPTQTHSPTLTPTPTPSITPTATSIMTNTATVTVVAGTATATSTVASTATPSTPESPTLTPTPSPTVPPSISETATPTLTETPEATAPATPTATVTATLSATATDTVTATATAEGTATATVTPTESHTASPTEAATATATASPSPTPSATPTTRPCPGDCDHSGGVSITDIVTMVDLALQSPPTATGCAAGDTNGDGQITIDEILVAVRNSLSGCPPA